MPGVIIPPVIHSVCRNQVSYAECHNSECHYAQFHGVYCSYNRAFTVDLRNIFQCAIEPTSLAYWKRIIHAWSARWQHLFPLKASAFLFEIFLLGAKKHNNSYLRLVMPSCR